MNDALRRPPWRRARSQEVALAAGVLLATGDPRAELLLRQLERSPVRRRRGSRRLELTLHWTTEELPDLDRDSTSDWVPVRTVAGRTLRVRVAAGGGGIFRRLEVESDDRLPRDLSVDPDALRRAATGALSLGGPSEHRGLRAWVTAWLGGLPEDCPVTATPGGTEARAALEREGPACPPDLLDLVEHADGLRVGTRRLFCAEDVWTVDVDGIVFWVVDESADDWTVLSPSGEVHTIDKGDDRPVPLGTDLRGWLGAGCR